MDINTVKEYVQLLKDEGLTVLSISDENMNIHLERQAHQGAAQPQEVREEPKSKFLEINAPQIGTFYIQKDDQDGKPFVTVGDRIKRGDQVGYIEAMKVFNDLISDVDGIVEEIVVRNGDDVEFGDVLIRVRPEEI